MEFVETLGIEKAGGRNRRFAIFHCKGCGENVKKRQDTGGRQENCGCIPGGHKHGLSKARVYRLLQNMKERCYNEKAENFKYYGARNIGVCDEWRNDPTLFVKWALSNGYSGKLQIDRIDNDGDYTPDNCRFVTNLVNVRNRGYNKLSLEKANEIRKLYSTGRYSQGKLSRMFDTSQPNIWQVIHYKIWA